VRGTGAPDTQARRSRA